MFQNDGYCYCCDSRTQFVATSDWWRDNYRCTNCDSLPRERALMFCIERFFPQWRSLSIHESSPVLGRGANRRLAKEAPAYIASHYYPGVAPGTIVNGIRCENLEHLSFGDESFDLHITQDVFEHLFDPAAACHEIARTLRPGGAHLFTTPLVRKNEPTRFCASLAPDGIVVQLVEPPEYHGNPLSSEGSLVTVNWGYDITNFIFETSGLFTEILFLDVLECGIRAEYIEAPIARKFPRKNSRELKPPPSLQQ
ncbi:MAG: class I SAM-dependent methyltransferase [Verrucomicrobia bacterium]|nr:MAG: class I SAM-dependent methyltransferase [Verrucomicrobiota bacterium]